MLSQAVGTTTAQIDRFHVHDIESERSLDPATEEKNHD
jgi:hypothetical protein